MADALKAIAAHERGFCARVNPIAAIKQHKNAAPTAVTMRAGAPWRTPITFPPSLQNTSTGHNSNPLIAASDAKHETMQK